MDTAVTVISGTFNRLPYLQALVASCRGSLPQGIPLDFVICDGGSTDGTLEWLHAQPDITVIEHGELRGAIRAFGDAAAAATGKYVLIANDDVRVLGNGLLLALVHLEDNPQCGAVPFADNRRYGYEKQEYEVALAPVIVDGREDYWPYVQVGMVRRWLGDACGWWGADDPNFTAWTYAGDNYLTAKIYEAGYTVEPVEGCLVHDEILEDTLRVANRGNPEKGGHVDSAAYYALYPNGPVFGSSPQGENPDKKQLRVLYMPIFEHGAYDGEYLPHVRKQHEQKRGLREAMARAGMLVYELDYLKYDQSAETLRDVIMRVCAMFNPHLILSQLHSADLLTAGVVQQIRAEFPRAVWVNWNGDYWPEAQLARPMLELLSNLDLALVVNGEVEQQYKAQGISAEYWQIAYEPVDTTPDMAAHDVVFLGNLYSPKRYALANVLKELTCNVGIYGNAYGGDFMPLGDTTYDFAAGRALYGNAKIALSDNQFLDAPGFFSNRVFEILAAGGAVLFQQRVKDMQRYTNLIPGVHFVDFVQFDELPALIAYWLDPARDKERKAMADAARRFVETYHSFDERVRVLFHEYIPRVAELRERVRLRYIGRSQSGAGGVIGQRTGKAYIHRAGGLLEVDKLDEASMIATGLWEHVEERTGEMV